MRKDNFSVGNLTTDQIRGGLITPFTKTFFIDPVNGSDGNSGKSISNAKKTWSAAYGLLTSAKNEALFFLPGASAVTTTTAIDQTKTFTHFIGLSDQWMNNRCRISTSTASMGTLFTATGQGCMYKNLLFSQEGSNATGNAVALAVVGHRCTFENISVRNIGALGVLDNSHRSMTVTGYDQTFKHCQIGETSYDAVTAASTVIEFTGTNVGKFLFEDCLILGAGSSSATFLTIPANNGGFHFFKNCVFHNSTISDLDAMTQAFSISGTGNDAVYLMDCLVAGVSALETSDSGILFGRNALATGTTDRVVALIN